MPYKPDDMPGLMPYIFVSNPEASLEFYAKAFGFSPTEVKIEDQDEIQHTEMTFMDVRVMFGREGAMGATSKTPANSGVEGAISLYIYCEDVDKHFEQAKAAGAEVLQEPVDMFWGDRMYAVKDPDGHKWTFATKVGEFDPSKMPQ